MCHPPAFYPGVSEVYYMAIIVEVRRCHSVHQQSISAVAHELGISRPTVRKQFIGDITLNVNHTSAQAQET